MGHVREVEQEVGSSSIKDCLIIGMFTKDEMPYTALYTTVLRSRGISYDLLYFNRYNRAYEDKENEISFQRYCPTGGSRFRKLNIMREYAQFVRRTIKRGSYKFLIVLTTIPAVFLFDILTGPYKDNYILDIRDYTHEENCLYKRMVGKLVQASYATLLSSRGFLSFLPHSDRYRFTHNVPMDFAGCQRPDFELREKSVVGFVGSVRYEEENIALLQQFSGRSDFAFEYWGTQAGGCNLQEYCERVYPDVLFHGPFSNQDKPEIYNGIDIINSIYGVSSKETTSAVPNRFYDAALYGRPIIVSKGTYLERLVEQYHLGFAVDVFRDDVPFELDDYCGHFSFEEFVEGQERLLNDVSRDIAECKAAINALIDKNEK